MLSIDIFPHEGCRLQSQRHRPHGGPQYTGKLFTFWLRHSPVILTEGFRGYLAMFGI